jgi:hypothetical protein
MSGNQFLLNEVVISDVIGLNPTGQLDFEGTFEMNGANDIVRNTTDASKETLIKTQKNEIICSSLENFQNKNYSEESINEKNLNNLNNFFILCIFLFLIIIFIYIFKKKY